MTSWNRIPSYQLALPLQDGRAAHAGDHRHQRGPPTPFHRGKEPNNASRVFLVEASDRSAHLSVFRRFGSSRMRLARLAVAG